MEAARTAGAGNGFAVVASVATSLAPETARATEDIAGENAAMHMAPTEAMSAVGHIDVRVERINRIATAAAEQNAISTVIARNIHQRAEVSAVAGAPVVARGQTDAAAGQVPT